MKTILVSILILYSKYAICQNLVPNSDFELFSSCPTATDQVDSLYNWFSALNSPDYFNSCTSVSQVSVPQNIVGYQAAFSGNGYCGLYTFYPGDYREYIGIKLNASLQIGQLYFISFWLSLSGKQGFDKATNKFGCKLTVSGMPYNSLIPDNLAKFHSDSIIIDTSGWVFIRGNFIADSSYEFLYLGNFFDNSHTDTTNLGGQYSKSYYYIENVCLSDDSLLCSYTNNVNEFDSRCFYKIYPNPCKDILIIASEKSIEYIDIFSIDGKHTRLYDLNKNLTTQKNFILYGLNRGIYLVSFIIDKKIFNYKIYKI